MRGISDDADDSGDVYIHKDTRYSSQEVKYK